LYGGLFWLIARDALRTPKAAGGEGPSGRDLLEFCLVVNLALLTAPISWTHYYVFLMIPWALYIGGQLPLPDDATTRALLRTGFVLTLVTIVMWSGQEPGLLNAILTRTVVSVWLFGGLLMFIAMIRGLAKVPAIPARTS